LRRKTQRILRTGIVRQAAEFLIAMPALPAPAPAVSKVASRLPRFGSTLTGIVTAQGA